MAGLQGVHEMVVRLLAVVVKVIMAQIARHMLPAVSDVAGVGRWQWVS